VYEEVLLEGYAPKVGYVGQRCSGDFLYYPKHLMKIGIINPDGGLTAMDSNYGKIFDEE
jgi:hypothetical protein